MKQYPFTLLSTLKCMQRRPSVHRISTDKKLPMQNVILHMSTCAFSLAHSHILIRIWLSLHKTQIFNFPPFVWRVWKSCCKNKHAHHFLFCSRSSIYIQTCPPFPIAWAVSSSAAIAVAREDWAPAAASSKYVALLFCSDDIVWWWLTPSLLLPCVHSTLSVESCT